MFVEDLEVVGVETSLLGFEEASRTIRSEEGASDDTMEPTLQMVYPEIGLGV